MTVLDNVAAKVQAKLDECYIAMKVNEKLRTYGRTDEGGKYFCHGMATALAIVRGTDAINEWHLCEKRFSPRSVAFTQQEKRMREILSIAPQSPLSPT